MLSFVYPSVNNGRVPNQRKNMLKCVPPCSGEIPSCRFYNATTSIKQSVYCRHRGQLTEENNRFIHHLLREEELAQNYQGKNATVLPGYFRTISVSTGWALNCGDEIPGKEFVMNISMIVLFSIPIHHLQCRDRLVQQVNLSNATYFNKKLSLCVHDKLWQLNYDVLLKNNAY